MEFKPPLAVDLKTSLPAALLALLFLSSGATKAQGAVEKDLRCGEKLKLAILNESSDFNVLEYTIVNVSGGQLFYLSNPREATPSTLSLNLAPKNSLEQEAFGRLSPEKTEKASHFDNSPLFEPSLEDMRDPHGFADPAHEQNVASSEKWHVWSKGEAIAIANQKAGPRI